MTGSIIPQSFPDEGPIKENRIVLLQTSLPAQKRVKKTDQVHRLWKIMVLGWSRSRCTWDST